MVTRPKISRRELPRHPILARTSDGYPIQAYSDAKRLTLEGQTLAPPLHPKSPAVNRREVTMEKDNKLTRVKKPRPKAAARQALIPWPTNSLGNILGGPWPSPPADAPPPESLGSLDWWSTASLGSSEEAIRLLESLISGQGPKAPAPLVRLAKLWRQWELDFSSGSIPQPPTLNQAAQALALAPAQVISFLQSGISALALAQSQVRLALGMPQVVAAAVASATDNENGFQDRKLLFEASGLITKAGGPAVVINNSNTQTTQPLATTPAVLQNLADAIDADIREAESEAIDGDFEDV